MPPKRKQPKKRVPRQKQKQTQSQKIVINNTTRRHYSNVPQKRPAEPSRRDIINIPVPQWGIPAQFDSNAGLVSALTGITELLKARDTPKVNTIAKPASLTGGNPPKVPEHVTKPILKSTEMQTNLSHFVPQEKGKAGDFLDTQRALYHSSRFSSIPTPMQGYENDDDDDSSGGRRQTRFLLSSKLSPLRQMMQKSSPPHISFPKPRTPQVEKAKAPDSDDDSNSSAVVPFVQKKRGGGRPKGSKNKPKFPQQPSLD